jgi:hypothetical protein
MGAPTWPPTPEAFYEEAMEETGRTAAELGLEEDEDEEAERALLALFLYQPPKRQLTAGEENGTTLQEVQRRLTAWLRMVTGQDFTVGFSDPPSTDGENLFLPKAVPSPEEPHQDELLYRTMGLLQLGLGRWGFLEERTVLAEIYRDWVLRSVYHLLASRWIMARWCEQYPGVARDFEAVRVMDKAGGMRVNVTSVPRDGLPDAFLPLYNGLTVNLNWTEPGPEGDPARKAVEAVDRAKTSQAARMAILGHGQTLRQHFRKLRLGPPPLPWYIGIIRPEWILADISRDLAYEQEWKKGQAPLRQLLAAKARNAGGIPVPGMADGPGVSGRKGLRGRLRGKLKKALKGQGPDLANMPAYGELRDEMQEQAKEQRYGAARWESGLRPDEIITNQEEEKPGEDGGREYDEWDYKHGLYKVSETKVFSPDGATGPIASYDKIVEVNKKEIKQIRRRFEALRVEERWIGGLPDGPEIDINRAIMAVTDIAAGMQPKEDFYRRFVRMPHPVCIMTAVDLSGSTSGNVLRLEQEALVLFAEGLRTLGMPHSFYGFNGSHPKECYLYKLKGFEDRYDETVYKRLGNLRASGGTRLGAFIRHASHVLESQPQPRRVLMLLSDGKPEGRGDYRGPYGIKDSAMAVQEAARSGIHVHCISMDPNEDAREYLAEIFGPNRFLLLQNLESLPMRLPEVFKDLVL